MRLSNSVLAGALLASAALTAEAEDSIPRIPLEGMIVSGPALPSEAELLAVGHFVREVRRITGYEMPQAWGAAPSDARAIRVGRASELPGVSQRVDSDALNAIDASVRESSYVLYADKGGIVAAGLGTEGTPRAALGISYALAELLRELDIVDGRWSFGGVDGAPTVRSPKVPHRTLYIMNSVGWAARGLSLDYDNPQSLEDYVDALIDAGYSRLAFWQWYMIYLYPGNYDDRRDENQRIHRGMRHLLDYGRRRGLEIYHMLTPMHANPDLLPDDPKFTATGYYGRTSVCWSQPEARELARSMARHEMEYYGPVDGYVVWFYDPGGCFCDACWVNQGKNLFEQLMLVVDLARSISPDAAFEAVLWPVWCFHEEQWGINFPREDVKVFVREFLDRALAEFGPRNLTIMDSCDISFPEYEFTIYDGTVKPEEFKRNGFMHRVLGTPGEASYPFSPFQFRFIDEVVGEARDRGLEESLFSAIYIGSTFPSVYAFAATLWHDGDGVAETIRRYAASVAKGDARAPFIELLTALEDVQDADTYEAKDAALQRAEEAWKAVDGSAHFYASRDWMRGYLIAQRRYLEMARAKDQETFDAEYGRLREELSAIPMYQDYVESTLNPELCVKFHVMGYWRGPVGDPSTVGLPGGDAGGAKWIGVPDAKR